MCLTQLRGVLVMYMCLEGGVSDVYVCHVMDVIRYSNQTN